MDFFTAHVSGPLDDLILSAAMGQTTELLLLLFFFFSIYLISSWKGILVKKFFPTRNRSGVLGHTGQALYQLSYSNIVLD